FILVFAMANWLWIFAVAAVFIPGQITILPLPLMPMELILCLVLARFVVENIIFKKLWIRRGPAPDWMFLFGLITILLIHGCNDRFAMRFFGSDIWGGRQYIAIIIGFLTYFVVQSTSLDAKAFRHLPIVVVLFGSFDFFMMAISQLVPGMSQVMWNFYTGVSLADTDNAMASRWGFMGNFGYLLLYWSLSDCRINEFITKGRVIKGAVFLLAIAMCIGSGYRSTVAVAALIVIVAAFRDFGFKGLFGFFPLVLALAILILIQSMGIGLPKQVQRGLTWLPGTWDSDVVLDANNSMDFRGEIWEMWKQTEFPKHPFFGRGFGLTVEQMMSTQPYIQMADASSAPAAYARNEAFVVSGNIHNGFYSVIDRFGIFGLAFFTLWTMAVVWRIWKYLLESRSKPMNPALQWLALYIIPYTISYWPGAQKIEQFLVQQLFFVGLFWALLNLEKRSQEVLLAKSLAPEIKDPELVPAPSHFRQNFLNRQNLS
ncbi:MAG: O-antigen ligase family protein, partial [Verrucomicrobiota bacterium]